MYSLYLATVFLWSGSDGENQKEGESNIYIGRDNVTKCFKMIRKISKNYRIRSHNIISIIREVTGYAEKIKTQMKIWKIIFSVMLSEIITDIIFSIQKSSSPFKKN